MANARLRIAAFAIIVALAIPWSAGANVQRAYARALDTRSAFDAYSRTIDGDRLGKFVIDVETDEIYFFDVNLFRLHADFVLGYLLKIPRTEENLREYNRNYDRVKPRFILGQVAYHTKVDRFTFAFWEGDQIDARGVARVYRALGRAFFAKQLAFRPQSPAQERVAARVERRGVPVVTNDTLYKASPYQPFNTGRAVGVLRVVPRGAVCEEMTFGRDEILLLQEHYPDVPPVAGILSTVFSTPLAHVNLRARAWGVPNAGYTKASDAYRHLDGRVVVYEVRDAQHSLRAATPDEIAAFDRRHRTQRTVRLPAANVDNAAMPMLTHIRRDDVTSFGAKTANLGEIAAAGLGGVDVPQGFGVPFFYYRAHLRRHGLDRRIDAMLDDPRWASAPAWRRAALEAVRAAIREAPLDPAVLDAVYKRVRVKLGGRGVFVRSSTNAEDLEGFNGAGLYDTVPNVRGKAALGDAVKQVWASLWNQRAVEEREAFGIDHADVYAGVLVQVGVDASAAGVLITANLYDPQDPDSFTINAKRGLGLRVVSGERVPEQVVFDTSNDGTKIITRSDDPLMLVFDEGGGIREVPNRHNGVILTEDRAKRLAGAVQAFLHLFPRGQPQDVEWLIEGDKVWIVQCRPFVQR